MLETIWFILWILLWAVYFMLDGFDLGVGMLLPFIGKTESQRQVMYKSVGPFWDGNEVWLIAAGGVTFAAFPSNYAVMFSALYTPLMLILFALIIRGIALEFRNKIDSPKWKALWDWCLILGSFAPTLLFGIAFANIFSGIPLNSMGMFEGNLLTLLTAYGTLGGILFMFLFSVHGCIWLAIKTDGELQQAATTWATKMWSVLVVFYFAFLIGTKFDTFIYNYYLNHLVLLLIPIVSAISLMAVRYFLDKKEFWKAWFSSGLTIVSITFFGLVGIYPNLLPSTISPNYSMTIFNSSSSPLTLKIMLGVVIVFVPIVLIYQIWAYNLFKNKVTEEELTKEGSY